MRITIKLIRNHYRQRVPSVVIQVDNQSYIFNVPETLQRFVKEHGVKFTSKMNIFFTGTTPHHISGMLGLSLTLFEHGLSTGTKLFGPDGVVTFFRNLKFLCGIKFSTYSMTSMYRNTKETPMIGCKDHKMLQKLLESNNAISTFLDWDNFISTVPAGDRNDATKQLFEESQYLVGSTPNMVFKDSNVEIFLVSILDQESGQVCHCYAGIFNSVKGGFIKEKLAQYKIKGKMIGLLKKESYIQNEDGITVKVEDVSEPDEEATSFLIVDCQEKRFIQGLIENETLRELFGDLSSKPYSLTNIIHFGGQEIINDARYTSWIESFSPKVHHMFMNEDFDSTKFYDREGSSSEMFRHQVYNNSLQAFFPKNFPMITPIKPVEMIAESSIFDKIHFDRYAKGLQYVITPLKKRGYQKPIDQEAKQAPTVESFSGFEEAYCACKEHLALTPRSALYQYQDSPSLCFLGTGSMMPSTYRNVSSICLNFGDQHMLMDCGEGSFSQMMDCVGLEKIDIFLKNLRVIFISHIHVDHNLGMFKMLAERQESSNRAEVPYEVTFILTPANLCDPTTKYNFTSAHVPTTLL